MLWECLWAWLNFPCRQGKKCLFMISTIYNAYMFDYQSSCKIEPELLFFHCCETNQIFSNFPVFIIEQCAHHRFVKPLYIGWCCKHQITDSKMNTYIFLFSGPQHSGRDGDGRDGPGDQHERNHHAGGCPEQDGEVWGKPSHFCLLYVWRDPPSFTPRAIVYSLQACVYAAPCMLLSCDLVDAP